MVLRGKSRNSDKRALIKTDFIEALLPGMQYDYITKLLFITLIFLNLVYNISEVIKNENIL